MRGLGASQGTARGKVKIITNLEKIENIKEGSILVMPYFSPLCVIHLHKVKGILTEFGGKTCHAAIIAREFNLPCITSIKDATKIFRNNQEIVINGKTGEIYGI